MTKISDKNLKQLVASAATAANAAQNERQLSSVLEDLLKIECQQLGASWSAYSLETYLPGKRGKRRFLDAVHGAVIIEYEPPKSFNGRAGATFKHACDQAEEYAELLSGIEGRKLEEYILVVWDGDTISFGKNSKGGATWDGALAFDNATAARLIGAIQSNGRPLVSQVVLAQEAGPDSALGAAIIPELFKASGAAEQAKPATKTTLLFAEWRRLFGQVIGVGDGPLREFIEGQSKKYAIDYAQNTPAYLFAVNTYIALLAKTVAACALPGAAEDIRDSAVSIKQRIGSLEDGSLFRHAGLTNMVSGDFFSWYADDVAWSNYAPQISAMIDQLADIDFDIAKKSPDTTRDLFKGIYETCVPRELRHALGEFYTPDWLAEHGMDVLGWTPENDLLDPTCGSGTFILEALRRRLAVSAAPKKDAADLISGIYGTDLNPLAVLAAKASLAVFISPFITKGQEIRLPVFLADAINPAVAIGDYFEHELPTEKGNKIFRLPKKMVESPNYYSAMARIQARIDDDLLPEKILSELKKNYHDIAHDDDEWSAILETIETIYDLHNIGWNGIWCSILADRFAAGSIAEVSHICGNPPWVKWSHLPPDYAEFIKPRCQALGVFSEDSWVGGIEADISTVITYESVDRYLAKGGKLGFFITGTVFKNESSEGFRKFSLHDGAMRCKALLVEDYRAIKPFEGVTNHPTFLVLEKGKKNKYPVKYLLWDAPADKRRSFKSGKDFVTSCNPRSLVAKPVPGGSKADSRPWMVGPASEISTYQAVFAKRGAKKVARKGVTTDRNGIFWVSVKPDVSGRVEIENLNTVGRTKGIAKRKASVEADHVFPLLRGKDIGAFSAAPSLHILVPQRGMHGEEDLPTTHPLAFDFLRRFKAELEKRSSLKRFQKGKPWYSLWSTGEYTFAKYKVAWKEMSGGRFSAAYIGPVNDLVLGKNKIPILDHKLYFLTARTQAEAYFFTGFLNAPCVGAAINAYASQLSLGTSVSDYVGIPDYDKTNNLHKSVSKLARRLSNKVAPPTEAEWADLNSLVSKTLLK